MSETVSVEWKLLNVLTEDERRELLGRTRRRRFRHNEIIFHEGDPGDTLHLIAKGHVAIRRSTPLGDIATLLVLGAGDFFGELVIVSPGSARNATVTALDDVETLTLHRDEFDALRRTQPGVDQLLLDLLAKEVRRLSTLLSEAYYVPVGKRVFRRLLEVASLYEIPGSPTRIPLTQDDLAGLAGTTRPSTNKALRAAEEAGLLAVSRGQVEILDADGLRKKAR